MSTTAAKSARPADIQAAKLAVMREVGYCQKTKAAGLGYSFASESALIEALRPAMVEAGITFAPVAHEILADLTYPSERGGLMRLVRIRSTFRLSHPDSGTHEDIVVLGEAADRGDKALPKAQTMALKYALRQTFVIETGDDPDKYPSEGEAVEAAPSFSSQERTKSTPYERWLRPVLHQAVKQFPNAWPNSRVVNDDLLREARLHGLNSLDEIKACDDGRVLRRLAQRFQTPKGGVPQVSPSEQPRPRANPTEPVELAGTS